VTKVAVIGVGRIGLPVVQRLVGAGVDVRAFDVRAEVRAEVESAGAAWAVDQAQAVADTDVVLTVLPGSPELREAMLGGAAGRPGLLELVGPGTTWIDLTSAAPDLAVELAHAAEGAGVDYLDAALGGGPDAARSATLTLYVGGAIATLDRHRPLLEAIARPDGIRHMGAAGSGYLTKLLVNALWFGQALAVGETLLMGQRAGLAPAALREVLIDSPAGSDFITTYLPALLRGDYLTSFGLDRCVEELDSVQRFVRDHQLPGEFISWVAGAHRAALAQLGPVDGELMGIAYLEQRAGSLLR
jgi:3-hydroxyisobutyrate dehydrogenase